MAKNIKQKEKKKHTIRKLDRTIAYTSRIKRNMIDKYKKSRRERDNKRDVENSNATNYATSKVIKVGNRGAKESAYIISGVSKKLYKKTKMKLANRKIKRNVQQKLLCEKNPTNDFNVTNKKQIMNMQVEINKSRAIREYSKNKLIKEKQDYKNIKEHSYKDKGIKKNTNSLKIKTRENANIVNKTDSHSTGLKSPSSNDLMKKSAMQKTKENTSKVKNGVKRISKSISDTVKKVAKRTKRNRNFSSFRWWLLSFTNCNHDYHYGIL